MLSTTGLSGLMLWFALMKSGLMLEFRALEMNAGSLRTVHLPEGKYQGILILGDYHDTWHANDMYRQLVEVKGIPGENIIQLREFVAARTSGDSQILRSVGVDWLLSSESNVLTDMLSRTFVDLRSQVRVIGVPVFLGGFGNARDQLALVDASNILFVTATGNTYLMSDFFGITEGDPRDFWQSDHPFWSASEEDIDIYSLYSHAYYMELFRTDNVILASSHGFRWEEDQSGDLVLKVFPGQYNMKCGEAKNNCFSLAVSPLPRTSRDDFLRDHPGSFTSPATVHLSAIAFYLAQFFPTAEEIVEVLRTCAIDVGEPGPDEEYGVGVVNLFCDEVFQQEAKVFAGSLQSSGKSSPALHTLSHRSPTGFVFRSALGLGFQGVQGHVGVSYATQSLQVVAMAGFALTPLSVSSSLFPISRVPFVEIGVRNSLNSSLSFIGTYGYQHGDLSVHSIRTGLQWEKSLQFVHFSVYGGRHFFHSSVGFPGYEMVGAQKVSFSQSAWETRFSLSFSL